MNLAAYENRSGTTAEPPQLAIRGCSSNGDLVLASYACMGVRPVFALLGLMILGLAGWVGWLMLRAGGIGSGLLMLGVPVFAVLWVLVIQPSRCLSAYADHRTGEGERTVHVLANGLTIESAQARRSFAWANFTNWREGWFCFVLMLPGGRFEFIPKRFFASRQDQQAFADLLRTRIKIRWVEAGSAESSADSSNAGDIPDLDDLDPRLALGAAVTVLLAAGLGALWRRFGGKAKPQ